MRFSVIIPVYNKGPYVKKALSSVLGQVFRDFELVVVDDGSSDDSLAVVESALNECTIPHQVIHQENAGVSMARNNGVIASCGDYVCFLDADDWWAPSFLERMDELIRDYPDAGIYGVNYYIVKNDKCRLAVHHVNTGYINYCQAYKNLQMPLTSISIAIPRKVFDEEKGFKYFLKLGEDFDLWIRIAMKKQVAFLNEPLAFYNQDVDPKWRGVGHLVDPRYHMLWNLEYLENAELTNPDYKRLIDELRVLSLLPYYLSKNYHLAAKSELAKVDWDRQPRKVSSLYSWPVFFLRIWMSAKKSGSIIKQWFLRHI